MSGLRDLAGVAEMKHTQPARVRPRTCIVNSFGGRTIDLLNPTPDAVDWEHIATGLSRISRWGGKTRSDMPSYSVAQHSLNVARLVPARYRAAALLHDAHESILGADICSPIRRALEMETDFWERITLEWDHAIAQAAGIELSVFYDNCVFHADIALRGRERDLLMTDRVSPDAVPDIFQPLSEFLIRQSYHQELMESITT